MIHQKSLRVEVSKDSLIVNTDSTNNDIIMVALIGAILITLVLIVVRYKLKRKK